MRRRFWYPAQCREARPERSSADLVSDDLSSADLAPADSASADLACCSASRSCSLPSSTNFSSPIIWPTIWLVRPRAFSLNVLMTGLLFVRGERWERRMFPLDNGRNDARSRRLIGITKMLIGPCHGTEHQDHRGNEG